MKRILTSDEQLSLSRELAPPPEPSIPAIDEALDEWLEAGVEAKRASETKSIRHQSLLAIMAEHGVLQYSFTERSTGKKKYVVDERTPTAKVKPAPKPKKAAAEREPRAKQDKSEQVESRRVSRKSVEKEINADPFAATRGGMGRVQ